MSTSQTTTPAPSFQERGTLGTKRRYHNKQSFCYIIRSGFAGCIAGSAAKTVVAPLDRVKILFQTSNPNFQKYAGTWMGAFRASKEIYKNTGFKGLFQGHSATLIRIVPYASIKFVAYEQISHILMPKQDTAFMHFVAGSLAGITSLLCVYPLDLIRVRLAYDSRVGYISLCKQIYHESAASHRRFIHLPIMNFYRGFNPSIMGMVPYAGISFLTHYWLTEFCRTELADLTTEPSLAIGKLDSRGRDRKAPLKTWADLTVGGLSGAIAQTIAYPLEVVRRRMQVYGALDPSQYIGIMQTFKTVFTANGFRGFFVGLSIGYLKVTPMVAISFTVYGKMKLYLNID